MKQLIFLIICCCISTSIRAYHSPSLRFEHYDDSDGLVQNSVRQAVQDKFGFLWFGTFNGLSRFDGYEFRNFQNSTSSNSIPNNDITAMVYDSLTHQLWMGTCNGLSCYDISSNRFTNYLPEETNKKNSLCGDQVRSLLLDSKRRLWIGTKENGLCWLNLKSKEFHVLPREIAKQPIRYIKSIIESSDGSVWFSNFYNTKVFQLININKNSSDYSNAKYYPLVKDKKETDAYIHFIFEDQNGKMWCGTRKGLFNLADDKKEFHSVSLPQSFQERIRNHFFTITHEHNGKYWLGTLGGLVSCNELEDLSTDNFDWHYASLFDHFSLTDDLISSLYIDKNGVLWVGTENGLDKLDFFQNQFRIDRELFRKIGRSSVPIMGMEMDNQRRLYVATQKDGVFLRKKNKYEPIVGSPKNIASFYTPNGIMFYCGLWNGKIRVYNSLKRTWSELDIQFKNTPVYTFDKLPNGDLIIGSHQDGAVLYSPISKSAVRILKDELKNSNTNCILASSNKLLWIGMEEGVMCYDIKNKKSKRYLNKLGLKEKRRVQDIAVDPKGVVWVATRGGLFYYDILKDTFRLLENQPILNENWVTDIRTLKNGNIWLNLNNNKVALYQTNKSKISLFPIQNGNRLDRFSGRGFELFYDSLLVIKGKQGLVHFIPESLKEDSVVAQPFITSVSVNNKKVVVGEKRFKKILLTQDINTVKKLTLPYDARNIAVTFSSSSLINPKLNKFRYRLDGFDETWITTTSALRFVQYTNLSFGKYQFHLQATNSSGEWGPIETYALEVERPAWLKWYALLSYFIITIALALVWNSIVRRENRLRQEVAVEKMQRENNELLHQERLKFFTNISHELRTPLTLIHGPILNLEKRLVLRHDEEQLFSIAKQNTSRLLSLINQILDFRKISTGKVKLHLSPTAIDEFTNSILLSFQGMADEKEISVEYKNTVKDRVWLDKDIYDKILFNLLSNALKFTPSNGGIQISTTYKNSPSPILELKVCDNGVGIVNKDRKKIFDRFYQGETGTTHPGSSGVGLSLVSNMVELHKGTISVESKEGDGSEFTIQLCVDKEAFDKKSLLSESTEVTTLLDSKTNKTEEKQNSSSTPNITNKKRILIVDDNEEMRQFITSCLLDCYDVLEAEDGEEALKLCKLKEPDLCISDIMMPKMNGFEFCETLKKEVEISHIPVVLLTALNDSQYRTKGYKLGADAYLSKPFEPDVLLSRIENILNKRQKIKKEYLLSREMPVETLSHSPLDDELLKKLSKVAEELIGDPLLNVKLLSKNMNMSASSLAKKMKELIGLTPNEFIRHYRLQTALQLLQSGEKNVSEVSDEVGFHDPLYFSRCFKKQFGYPPSKAMQQTD